MIQSEQYRDILKYKIKNLYDNKTVPMRWKLMKRYFAVNDLDYKVFIAMSNQANVKIEIEKIKQIYKSIK